MDRRLFTKVAGVSVIGVLAGCTSPDEEPEDDTDADDATPPEDDQDPADDPDDGDDDPVDDSDDGDGDVDDGSGADDDADETDGETDDAIDDSDDEESEADDTESGDDDSEDGTDGEDDASGDDEEDDDETADSEDGTDGEDDAPEEPGELDAELALDDELEDLLAVDHEFIWESDEGSHLCNINVEMENTTSDSELFYEGVGMITDADGNHLSSDAARFSLGSENSAEHTFSLDQCAEATTYRVEFNADQVVEE